MFYISSTQNFISSFSKEFFVDSNLVSMKSFSKKNIEKMIEKTSLVDWNISSNTSHKIFSFLYYLIENKEPQKIINIEKNNQAIYFSHWKDFSFLLYSLWKKEKDLIFQSPLSIDDPFFHLIENFFPIDLSPTLNLSLNDINFDINKKQQNFHDIIERIPFEEKKIPSYLLNIDSAILNNEEFLTLLWQFFKKKIPKNFPLSFFENEKFLTIILNNLQNENEIHSFWEIPYFLTEKEIKNDINFICIFFSIFQKYKHLNFPYFSIKDLHLEETLQEVSQKNHNNDDDINKKIKILSFFKNHLFNNINNLIIFDKQKLKLSYQSLYFAFFSKEIKYSQDFFDFQINHFRKDFISNKIIYDLINNYIFEAEKNYTPKEMQHLFKQIFIKKIIFDKYHSIQNQLKNYLTNDFIISLFEDSAIDKNYLFQSLSLCNNDWRFQESFIENNIKNNWVCNYQLLPKEKVLYENYFSTLLEKKQFEILLQLNKSFNIENNQDFKNIINLTFFYNNQLNQKKIKEKIPNFELFLNSFDNYKLISKHTNLSKIYPLTKTMIDIFITDENSALEIIYLNRSIENIPSKYLENPDVLFKIDQSSLLKYEHLPKKLFFQKEFIWKIINLKIFSIFKEIPLPIWQDSQFINDFFIFIEKEKINFNLIKDYLPKEISDIFLFSEKEKLNPIEIFKLLKEKRILQQKFSQKETFVVKKNKL